MTSIGSSGSGAFLNIYVINAVSSKRIEKRKMSLPVPHNSARLLTGYTIHWITQEVKSFCIKSLLLVKGNHTNVQSRLQPFTSKGRCWHQSVSPTLVLARLGNATASLPLRGQPRRKALRSYPAGQVRRKEKHPRPSLLHPRPYALVLTVTPDFWQNPEEHRLSN